MEKDQIKKIDRLLEKLLIHSKKGKPDEPAKWVINGKNDYFVRFSAEKEINDLYHYLNRLFPNVTLSDYDHILTLLLGEKIYGEFIEDHISERFLVLSRSITDQILFKPIYNLEVEKNLKFAKFDFNTREIESKFSSALPKDWQERNKLGVLAWASISLSGTKSYVEDLFDGEINNHLSMLNFLYHLLVKKFPSDKSLCSIKPVSQFKYELSICSHSQRQNFSSSDSMHREYLPVKLSSEVIDQWGVNGYFKKTVQILESASDNSFESRLIRAASFYNEALRDTEDIKLLKSVIGLESLLSTGKDVEESRIGTNLAEKVAFLFSDEKYERINIREYIKELYDYRCKVGHGQKRFDTILDAYDSEDILFQCMKLFLDKLISNEFQNDESINSWFLEKKMS